MLHPGAMTARVAGRGVDLVAGFTLPICHSAGTPVIIITNDGRILAFTGFQREL